MTQDDIASAAKRCLATAVWNMALMPSGEREKMIGKLQERYGYGREQAEKELDDFLNAPQKQPRRSA